MLFHVVCPLSLLLLWVHDAFDFQLRDAKWIVIELTYHLPTTYTLWTYKRYLVSVYWTCKLTSWAICFFSCEISDRMLCDVTILGAGSCMIVKLQIRALQIKCMKWDLYIAIDILQRNGHWNTYINYMSVKENNYNL